MKQTEEKIVITIFSIARLCFMEIIEISHFI